MDGVCGSGNKIGKGVKVCRCFILERFKITMALNSKASEVAIVKLFYVNTKVNSIYHNNQELICHPTYIYPFLDDSTIETK